MNLATLKQELEQLPLPAKLGIAAGVLGLVWFAFRTKVPTKNVLTVAHEDQ